MNLAAFLREAFGKVSVDQGTDFQKLVTHLELRLEQVINWLYRTVCMLAVCMLVVSDEPRSLRALTRTRTRTRMCILHEYSRVSACVYFSVLGMTRMVPRERPRR